MQRAVDGDNVALTQHLLKVLNSSAANLLLLLGAERLVVEVQQLLAVEGLQSAEHTLTNTAHCNSSNNLVLEIELVLGHSRNVPVSGFDLVASWNEVADEGQDSHNDMLGNGDDIAASDFGDSDTTIGLVGGIQVNVVRANTSSDGNLQFLGLGETFGGQVTRMEAKQQRLADQAMFNLND